MLPRHPRRATARTVAALLAPLAVLVPTADALAAPRPPRSSYPAAIEPLAGYEPQKICSPTAKPGTAAFASLALQSYPGTRSLGIIRACSIGGASEHKEGRAFDWGVSAYSAADRAKAADMIDWLLATDRYGNRYAMARRLGIQYIIWNRRIWGAYAASSGWRAYSGPNPHTDHVHFSFTWAGANKQTSFWTGRVAGSTSTPPPPTTPPPAAPAARTDMSFKVPAKATTGVMSPGALQAGATYEVTVSGTYNAGRGVTADAECSATVKDRSWRRYRSVTRDPKGDQLDALVDSRDVHGHPAEQRTAERCDSTSHTYRFPLTVSTTRRVNVRVGDPTKSDNSGSLSVRMRKVASFEGLRVSATTPSGARTTRSYRAGVPVTLRAVGSYTAAKGVTADAECSATRTDRTWRVARSALLRSGHPLGDTTVNGRMVTWTPVRGTAGCSGTVHAYTLKYTPRTTGPLSFKVLDTTYTDNKGEVSVTVERIK